MLPCPTVIDSKPYLDLVGSGKTIIFTAYYKEQFYSKEWIMNEHEEDEVNEVEVCWYPTTFFYDLEKNCTIWEIFGAEQFIAFIRNRVMYLTNDMWREIDYNEYEMLKQE